MIITRRVKYPDGEAIKNAEIEIWQTAKNGLYSNIDPAQDEYNLRAHMKLDDDGKYALTTVRPAPYTVPDDGPVGELPRSTGRHPWRPSHLHFIITAPGYRPLVTEVFPSEGPYLDEDAAFGVRERLVMEYIERSYLDNVPSGLEIARMSRCLISGLILILLSFRHR